MLPHQAIIVVMVGVMAMWSNHPLSESIREQYRQVLNIEVQSREFLPERHLKELLLSHDRLASELYKLKN